MFSLTVMLINDHNVDNYFLDDTNLFFRLFCLVMFILILFNHIYLKSCLSQIALNII